VLLDVHHKVLDFALHTVDTADTLAAAVRVNRWVCLVGRVEGTEPKLERQTVGCGNFPHLEVDTGS
jgi:hypothetical protein